MRKLKHPNRRCRSIISASGLYFDNWLVGTEALAYIVVRHKLALYKKIIMRDKYGKFTHVVDFSNENLRKALEKEMAHETI